MRWKPSPSMAVALVALFVSLSGVTWAAINENSVRSKHIKDGQVKNPDIGVGAVTTEEVAEESLIGDDLIDETVSRAKIVDGTITGAKVEDATLTGAKIADGTVTGANIAGGSLTGAHVGDSSLGGADVAGDSLGGGDIDESSLSGLTTASGSSACCSLFADSLDIGTAYSSSNPSTFVVLSDKFELRTRSTPGIQDGIALCDTTGTTFAQLAYADLSGIRDTAVFEGPPRCEVWDINAADDNSFVGEIEIQITSPGITVWGSTNTGGVMLITVLEHH
jgi:hypothetical protein